MTLASPNTIAVRAYSEPKDFMPRESKPGRDLASEWSLTFDCETTICPAQALRVGFYQIHNGTDLQEEGAFYLEETLSRAELETLTAYCKKHGLKLLTRDQFNIDVFLRVGYELMGTVIGFNLPFDISRVAIKHSEARGSMRGGFSFNLVESERHPRARAKHLSANASLIDFAMPGVQETPRGMRRKGLKVAKHRGYFVDVKTVAAALTSRAHSLESLCMALGTITQKHTSEDHGAMLSPSYLDYARADVQATWECYLKLKAVYDKHGLSRGLPRILSEASLGKAYLSEMGIQPIMMTPRIDRVRFGPIMSAYYGGRAEVRIRRQVTEIIYTDFKSMYPTVNILMGLWRFVIAEGYTEHDATKDIQSLLKSLKASDFQSKEFWKILPAIVRIQPDSDLLPVRSAYNGSVNTIGLNHLTYKGELWYSLADICVTKLLTGKTPEIIEALAFKPGPLQKALKPIELFGDPSFLIDPEKDDLFKRLIDLRDLAKANKDDRQLAIKILANSTSYGIFIEIQSDKAPKNEPILIADAKDEFSAQQSTCIEQPGLYFHPALGVSITGAARLMLALAEHQAEAQGLGWAFCDTDSLAIAKPDNMDRDTFHKRVQSVVDWFDPLNPYDKLGSILQIEDVNYDQNGQLQPLYAYAISAKRYALFNIDDQNRPIIRKASAHGLGHLREPYDHTDPTPGISDPVEPLHKIGVKRWQYDLWFAILSQALKGEHNVVPLDYHPALQKPAMMRYGATSPALLKWMRHYNEGKPYHLQIKPFGFLVSFQTKSKLQRAFEEQIGIDPNKRGRPTKVPDPKPVASFERAPELAASKAFDRVTGEPLSTVVMQTYPEALTRYHLSPESKFENADFFDRGETIRRHIMVTIPPKLIGKEANGVGEVGESDPVSETVVIF